MNENNMKANDIVWNWRDAGFGVLISVIPIIVIVTGHAQAGLPMLIGLLPAATMGT